MKKHLEEAQSKLDARIEEIRGMSNKQLVWALCAESGWHYAAERDMRRELAENTYKDMELLKMEILGRMQERHFPLSPKGKEGDLEEQIEQIFENCVVSDYEKRSEDNKRPITKKLCQLLSPKGGKGEE